MSYIYLEAERLSKKFNTKNPFELLDAIGAVTILSDKYEKGGLKGFATIINRQMFAFINSKLDEHERRIVAGHEAAHLILHKNEILTSPACALKDFNIYGNAGKLELEANVFLANFLVSDKDVLKSTANPDGNFYTTAAELFMPPPLLAIKIYSMVQRGHDVKSPEGINSKFLK